MNGSIIKWSGEQITKAGIYSGIPMDQYHGNPDLFAGKCISTSGVRAAGGKKGSALDYWAYSIYNPDRYEFKVTRAVRLGKAAHLLVLGDEPFYSQFVDIPKDVLAKNGAKSGNKYKEWLEEVPDGIEPLTDAEMATITATAKAIAACPEAHQLLGGLIEHTIVWQDEVTGLWLRARPDNLPMSGVVGDLKCSEMDHDPAHMEPAVSKFKYHAQLAMIGEGMKIVTGHAPTHYSLVFAGLKEPHHIIPVSLNEDWIEHGRLIFREGVDRIAEGFESGEWKTRADTVSPDGIVTPATPAWMAKQLEQE